MINGLIQAFIDNNDVARAADGPSPEPVPDESGRSWQMVMSPGAIAAAKAVGLTELEAREVSDGFYEVMSRTGGGAPEMLIKSAAVGAYWGFLAERKRTADTGLDAEDAKMVLAFVNGDVDGGGLEELGTLDRLRELAEGS